MGLVQLKAHTMYSKPLLNKKLLHIMLYHHNSITSLLALTNCTYFVI